MNDAPAPMIAPARLPAPNPNQVRMQAPGPGQAQNPPLPINAQFAGMQDALNAVRSAMEMQNISKVIDAFAGNPEEFDNWTKAIDKFMRLTQIDEESKHLVAYQASAGLVSDFIARYLEATPDPNWQDLLPRLRIRFAGVKDTQHALALLSRVRQGRGEAVPIYAERVHALVDEAFPGPLQQDAIIGRQIVGYFVDGLAKDRLKMKILREDPVDLEVAVMLATREDNLEEKLSLRTTDARRFAPAPQPRKDPTTPFGFPRSRVDPPRREEPMEVDRQKSTKCYRCQGYGHVAKQCPSKTSRYMAGPRSDKRVSQVVTPQAQRAPPQWMPTTQQMCWRCGQPGHFKRECPNDQGL